MHDLKSLDKICEWKEDSNSTSPPLLADRLDHLSPAAGLRDCFTHLWKSLLAHWTTAVRVQALCQAARAALTKRSKYGEFVSDTLTV
jgi:hypothetical protein